MPGFIDTLAKRCLLVAAAALASCSHGTSGGGGGGTPPTPPPHVLYVSTTSNVSIFNATATGNASPIGILSGTNTGLNGPAGIGLDSGGRLYAVNASAGSSSVTVYAKGVYGNAAPLRTVTGSATNLTGPYMLALDASDKLYVTNNSVVTGGADGVVVFAAGANGNATPLQTITGSLTGLATPTGIGVDSAGEIVVANAGTGSSSSSIAIYGKGSNGNVPPIRKIAGTNTKLNQPEGVLVDSSNRIWVCNGSTGSISNAVLVFAAGATGNVAPIFTLGGSATQMIDVNVSLTFDSTGALDVVNSQSAGGASTVLEYAGLNATTLPSNGNIAPARVVSGLATGLTGGFGIAAR